MPPPEPTRASASTAAGPRAREPSSSFRRGVIARAPALVAAAAGLAWLLAHAGASPLVPTHVGWVMKGDFAASYVGWAFYRDAPWGLPLGDNPAYPWPVGSAVAYSDSIPLLAALLKPASPILPASFQYLGIWLALAFALQGYAGARLVALFTRDRTQEAAGGALLAISPVLLHRLFSGHASLCGHFLVLAAMWIVLAPVDDGRVARRRLAGMGAILLLAAGIHPYLLIIGFAHAAALLARLAWLDRALRPGELAAWALADACVAVGGLALFGFVGSGASTPAQGFGYFSADPLTLLNPMGWSRVLPSLPVGPGQYEGFGFLGAGVIVLALAGLALLVRHRRLPAGGAWRRAAFALAPAALLGVLALSDVVQSGARELLRVPAYDLVPAVGANLRSSGRFVWPLHYLATLAAVGAVVTALRARPRLATGVLLGALALQAADVRPAVARSFDESGDRPADPAPWAAAASSGYRHLSLIPPQLMDGAGPVAPEACGDRPLWAPDHWAWIGALAARSGLTTNSGYLARVDVAGFERSCLQESGAILAGRLEPSTIYVIHPSAAGAFRAARATCGRVGGAWACVDGARTDPFSRALRAAPIWR